MEDGQASEWRDLIPPHVRPRVINKICNTLIACLPTLREEDLARLATRFENNVFEAATSEIEYIRRIALRMLSFEAEYAGRNASDSAFNAPPYDEL